MKLADAYVDIGARTGKLEKGLSGVRQRLKRMGTGMRSLARTGALMFAGLATAAGLAVRSFAQQEEAEAKLEAVLRATGHAAGFSASQLKKQAAELQKLTGIGDEVIMSTQAILATFKEIKGDEFGKATQAIIDMNTVLGTGSDSLRTMAIQVGKALNDPLQGLTALRRSGVSFTEEQKKLIKTLVDTGEKAKAQAIIIKELENEFGGAAKAVGDTFGGQLKKLSADFGDMTEEIGEMIAALLTLGGNFDALRDKIRAIPEGIRNFVDIFVLASLDMRKKWISFTTDIQALWEETTGLVAKGFLALKAGWDITIAGLKLGFEGFISGVKIGWLALQKIFSNVMANIISSFSNFISKLEGIPKIGEKFAGLRESIDGLGKGFSDSTKGIEKDINGIKTALGGAKKEFIETKNIALQALDEQDKATVKRIDSIVKAGRKELNLFDGIRKEYLEGMEERKVKSILADKDIKVSNNKTQEEITEKQKDENKKRGAEFFGLADIWKKAQAAALGIDIGKEGFAGIAGTAVPARTAAEIDMTPKELLSESKKSTDTLDSIDKQLKDGITVNTPEAQMS